MNCITGLPLFAYLVLAHHPYYQFSEDQTFDRSLTPQASQQEVDRRQDVGSVSPSGQVSVVAFLGGLAILALHLLPIVDSLGLIRPRLENDPRCGLTTGGQVCVVVSSISQQIAGPWLLTLPPEVFHQT